MNDAILKFKNFLNENMFMVTNPRILVEIIKEYSFHYFPKEIDFDQFSDIKQNIINSKAIIINKYQNENQASNKKYFIIGFEKTIIIIDQFTSFFLKQVLSLNKNLSILFLFDANSILKEIEQIKFSQIKLNENLIEEIHNFNSKFSFKEPSIRSFFRNIISCITGYFIQKGYQKTSEKRIDNVKSIEFNENNYVELRTIGFGSL